MYSYQYGGKTASRHQLEEAEDLLVVRTKQHKSIKDTVDSIATKKLLSQLLRIAEIEAADVTVFQCQGSLKELTHIRDKLSKKRKFDLQDVYCVNNTKENLSYTQKTYL
jgi:pyruvate formate-lyase activating enzyme-like uncharacterized protein